MSKQIVDIGVQGNDGTGDSIRESFRKVNENFTELYAVFGVSGKIKFTSLDDTPASYSRDQIIMASTAGDRLTARTLVAGNGIEITGTYTNNPDDTEIVISSSNAGLLGDIKPALGQPLNINLQAVGRIPDPSALLVSAFNSVHPATPTTLDQLAVSKGYADRNYVKATARTDGAIVLDYTVAPAFKTRAQPVLAPITDPDYDPTLTGNYTSTETMQRKDVVYRGGDSMSGELILSDHPAPLAGFGAPNGTSDLQAATKFYVDNQVFSSGVNLYVSTTSGDDLQQRTPPGKEGRFWQYSYKTIGAAALAAENLINLASQEPGPYRQRISYTIGPDQTFSTIQSVTLIDGNTQVAGYQDAYDLLQLNREFIQKETIAYINNKYVNTLNYDRLKCQRDVGYILDAVGYDLVLGTNYNVTTAATQYFVADANKVTGTQLIQTIDGIRYARDTVLDFSYVSANLSTYIGEVIDALCFDLVFQSNFQTLQVGLSFSNANTDLSTSEITDVINNLGTGILALAEVQAVTASVNSITSNITNLISIITTGELPVISMPSLPTTTTGKSSARDLLLNNIRFIQAEVVSFLNSEYPNLPYNQTTFKQNVQYIIWSIVYDMLYGGNSKSITVGKNYWADTTLSVTATASANDAITISDTTLLGIGQPITFIGTDFGNIVAGDLYYVAAILDGTHFTISETRGGTVFPLTNDTGSLTIQNRIIAGIEVYPTIESIDYIKALAADIVSNITPVTLYQQSIKQYKNDTLSEGSGVVSGLNANFNSIKEIITDNSNISIVTPTVSAGALALQSIRTVILNNKSAFRTAAITYVINNFPVINDQTTLNNIEALFNVVIDLLTLSLVNRVDPTFGSSSQGAGYTNAKTLLMENLDFIADETAEWLAVNEASYVADPSYDEDALKRNIKDFTESAAYEIIYSTAGNNVNSAGISRGLYLKTLIYNDLASTWDQIYIDAITFAQDLASNVIINQSPTTAYSSTGQFKDLGLTGGVAATSLLSSTFSLITNIAKGNTVPSIVQPILTSYSVTYRNARDLIVANTEDISVNTTAYLDVKYKGGFSYDEAICSRDVGLITDGLAIDIITGGTWQSVFAGKSYYRNASAKAVAIGTQYTETVDALKFHGNLCAQVLNQTVASRYQTIVPQYFNPLKNVSAGAKQALTTNFNIILSIIENGIGAAPVPSFGTGIWQVVIDNGSNGYVDQGVPGNVDIIPAKVIVGVDSDTVVGSGAYASIVKYLPGVDISTDTLNVRLTKPGFFKIGEQIEFGETVRDVNIVIQVEAGIYYEDYPIRVPANVSIRGDEFRRTIVRPRDRISQSPWRKVFFYRDAVIDALELGPYDYSIDYTTTVTESTAVVGGTNAKIVITLGTGQVPGSWIGKVFMDDYFDNGVDRRGKAIIDSVSGNVMNCSVIYPFNAASTIAYGDWHIYGTINYGRHYLSDPLDITSPAKNNKQIDVLLCNDAVRISNTTFQGHGGFIMVLDPEGQIKTKSPYGQVCSSFSQSTNRKRFAGGQFIDGFSGRLFGTIIDVQYDAIVSLYKLTNGNGYTDGTYTNVALIPTTASVKTTGTQATADIVISGNQVTSVAINDGGIGYVIDDVLTCEGIGAGSGFSVSVQAVTGVGNGITVTVQGSTNSGLDIRPPQPPCAFFVQGSRYQVNDVVSFDSTTATVVLTMDVGTPYNIASFYDNAKCSRDVGYIIEAATYDTVIGSNYQSIAAARAYSRINAATVINNQKVLTLSGFNKATVEALAAIPAGSTYDTARSTLSDRMAIVSTVIDQGLTAAPAISYPTAGAATANAAKLRDNFIANRSFVQTEITAWISDNYIVRNIPNYNALTCQRDVGYIIDAMIYDIMYGGNSMTYDAASSYYLGTVSQAPGEEDILVATYTQMKDILQQIATNTTITKSAGNTATQVIDVAYDIPDTDAAYIKISTLVDIVIDYAYDGDFDTLTTRTAPTIAAVGLDINLLAARTAVIAVEEDIKSTVIDYLNSGGGLRINIEGGGNKSMLANDFAMINDLGYAVVAYNGGVTEQVSTFTYYCHTHYWAGNGGQIRSVAGSNAHGDYALRASGYDITEKPDSVNIFDDMSQSAKVYKQGITTSEMIPTDTKPALAVWILNYSYAPYNISEIEIDHTLAGGGVNRYQVNSVEHTTATVNGQNVLKVNLSSTGNNGSTSGTGLAYALYDGQIVQIRSLQNHKFYNVDNVKPTRPSTALQFNENLADIYRVIAYNLTESTGELLEDNIAVLQTDASFDYYKFVTELTSLNYVDPDYDVTITSVSGDGTTATITFGLISPAPFAIGDKITVQGVTPVGYNGSYIVTGATTSSVSYANTTTASMTIPGVVGLKTMGLTVGDYKIAVIPITVQTTIDQINKGIFITSYSGRTHRVVSYTSPITQPSAQYVSGGSITTTMIVSGPTGTITSGMRVTGSGFTTQTVVSYTPPVSPSTQATVVLSGTISASSGTLYFGTAVPAYISIDPNPTLNIVGDGTTIDALTYVSKNVPVTGKKFVTYNVAWNPDNLPIVDNFYKISGQANTLYNGYHRIGGLVSKTQLTVADTTSLQVGMVVNSTNPLAYIKDGTTIQSIDSANKFTVSPAAWIPPGTTVSSTVYAVIDRIDIVNGGSGYDTPPIITIGSVTSGSGTVQGKATCKIDPITKAIISVTVVLPGYGYLSAPDVKLSVVKGGAELIAVMTATATQNTVASAGVITHQVTTVYDTDPGDWIPDTQYALDSFNAKSGSGPYLVTLNGTFGTAPQVGSFWTMTGNSNTAYNGTWVVTASSTTTIEFSYPTDPGSFGTGSVINLQGKLVSNAGIAKATATTYDGVAGYSVSMAVPTTNAESANSWRQVFGSNNTLYNGFHKVISSSTTNNTLFYPYNPDYIITLSGFTSINTSGGFFVTFAIPTQGAGASVGSSWIVSGNSNASYNAKCVVTASTTTSITLSYASNPGTYGTGTTTVTLVQEAINVTTYNTKSTTEPWLVTLNIATQNIAPLVGSYWSVTGNSNSLYNRLVTVTASTTSTITVSYPTDPGAYGTGTTTLTNQMFTIAASTNATSESLGINKPFDIKDSYTVRAGYSANSYGQVTTRISTCRVTGHDLLDIGTGSYSTTNYPYQIYGNPAQSRNQANEVYEEGVGRVFYVTTDQNGIFRVGRFFTVDQGTGTVTFSASIALSNLDGLGFKRGVVISEFSSDTSMTNNAPEIVPVQSAVRGYIDKRLGLDHGGGVVAGSALIGSGYLALNGQLQMKGSLNMGTFGIGNLATPTANTDATTKLYVDTAIANVSTLAKLQDVVLSNQVNGDTWVYDTSLTLSVTGAFGTGNAITFQFTNPNSYTFKVGQQVIVTSVVAPGGNPVSYNGTYSVISSDSTSIVVAGTATNTWVSGGTIQASAWKNVTLPTGDVNITYSSVTKVLTATIQAGKVVNSMVSASAAIDQSKLAMTIATTRASAPTGTAAQKQAASGLASFDSANFEITDGFVGIKANGVAYTELANIADKTVLGNFTGASTYPREVTAGTIVSQGDGIKNASFTYGSAGTFVMQTIYDATSTNNNTYSLQKTTTTGESSSLVKTTPTGDITATGYISANSYINGNQIQIDSYKVIDTTSTTLQFFTPGNASTPFATSVGTSSANTITSFAGERIDLTATTLRTKTLSTGLAAGAGSEGTITGQWSLLSSSQIDFTAGNLKSTTLSTGRDDLPGTIQGYWSLSGTSRLQATFADLAEYYEGDQEYEAGTVLVFGGDKEVTTTTQMNDTRSAGVVTTNPAYVMNSEQTGIRVCLALAGRVPCKVVGRVKKGDMLTTSSTLGYAVKANDPKLGSIIGKALEDKDYGEGGVIQVAIGRV